MMVSGKPFGHTALRIGAALLAAAFAIEVRASASHLCHA
jgi:hypothetical protein